MSARGHVCIGNQRGKRHVLDVRPKRRVVRDADLVGVPGRLGAIDSDRVGGGTEASRLGNIQVDVPDERGAEIAHDIGVAGFARHWAALGAQGGVNGKGVESGCRDWRVGDLRSVGHAPLHLHGMECGSGVDCPGDAARGILLDCQLVTRAAAAVKFNACNIAVIDGDQAKNAEGRSGQSIVPAGRVVLIVRDEVSRAASTADYGEWTGETAHRGAGRRQVDRAGDAGGRRDRDRHGGGRVLHVVGITHRAAPTTASVLRPFACVVMLIV